MELGVFSYSYHLAFGKHEVFKPENPMDIFDFMDLMCNLNVDGVQIDIMHLESRDSDYLSKVGLYAKNKGLFIEYGSTGIEENHTLNELYVAHKLGAKLMRTFMGFNRYDGSSDAQYEVDKAINVIKDIIPTANELGIKIAIENHCDATVDEMVEIMQAINSETVGVCVDLGNFMIHQEKPIDSVRKLAPYIINTHFKDYTMEMMNWGFKSYGVPLGQGIIDLKGILEILKRSSNLNRIVLEIPVEKDINEDATLKKERAYVEESVRYARETLEIF
ncbi:Sugar phosphate isomerase/epimerase [Halolactibacillus halophilus]|uniref:Sugar phosphate isomerase/epimerase n=1 Tax=Halolactibacillus halophilus TaxID=306540 RepID=A0A1I5LWX6_9BACI|nr:sugar phosphate isomerase/epimerase family protein [Halolactibacillus halophilus]GEM00914.1 hypothetical protein HHA03_04460 [Halolactibacillus halophilus]SFP01657.1 Sugar phosphate isomerase/epimerase [Halolactibacillus halophilus]